MNRVTQMYLKESVEMVSCINSNRVSQVISLEQEPGQKHGVSKSVGKQTLPNRVVSGQAVCLTGWQSLCLSTV